MPAAYEKTYEEMIRYARQTAQLGSIEALLEWDERVMMPADGGDHRASQLSLLAGMVHDRWTSAPFGGWLDELGESPLASDPISDTGATIRRLTRQYDKKVKLPKSLVEELARLQVISQRAWEQSRRDDDFPSFQPHLEKMIELKRQEADALGYKQCRYDALLDDYEPEELTSNVRRVLASLRDALVPLVGDIAGSAQRPDTSILGRDFPLETQRRFGEQVAAELGFDFERGRLDVTAHPFCTTLGPHDCRLTTRSVPRDFSDSFFSILHEAGHGIYEQGLRDDDFGLPLGSAVSLGIHESQSRMWENLVGRSHTFWEHFYPQAQRAFAAALGDVTLDDFYFAVNEVRPSLIRTEADEVTYNLHVMVRFELEQALLEGDLPAGDLPGVWNEKYREYLGIDPPNAADGVLQDIHWSAGLFGYFPTYALGNLYAAQFFRQADSDLGGLEEQFRRGEFEPLLGWLQEKIHSQGERFTPAQLLERATGEPLSHDALIAQLRSKFGPLYGI